MITSAYVLIATVALIFLLWTLLHMQIAKKEFLYYSEQRKWIRRCVLFFVIWVGAVLAAGQTGILENFENRPPPFFLFMICILILPFFITFSKIGDLIVKNVTVPLLVAFQSFRILAELAIFLAVKEGLAPVQMSLEGYNFDIITGVSALFVAVLLARRKSRALGWAWNFMGLGFLLVVIFIAATSMPSPLRLFMNEPSNLWVTHVPYILLPGLLVSSALTAHLLAFRLLMTAGSADGLQQRDF